MHPNMPSASFVQAPQPRVWAVGALCRAIADAMQARFNPVAVEGEISGLGIAGSGHMYFSIKDEGGQLRCAMFRRAASLLDFEPREGQKVTIKGRLGVYEPRGELQLVVESMTASGQGALFEQFLRLKARLEAAGLFDEQRKRALAPMPRGLAVITSLNAAALHDVATALRRRCPHVPVLVVPALVQGVQAPASLCAALETVYEGIAHDRLRKADGSPLQVDAILLVRGGGSIEDLWAFNDEQLARTIVKSPVPLISGVGHETDFTIADFCADRRAPTPTAAAEMAAASREQALAATLYWQDRLAQATDRQLAAQQQRLERLTHRLKQPAALAAMRLTRLQWLEQQLRHRTHAQLQQHAFDLAQLQTNLPQSMQRQLERVQQRLHTADLRLQMLNPQKVLERGYAILQTDDGHAVQDSAALPHNQRLHARVARGEFEVRVVKQQELAL